MAASAPPLVRTAVATLCQSASAAHTASSSARLSASKTTGLPVVGVCCALMETVTERLPSPLAAANWV